MDEALDIFRADGLTLATLDRIVADVNFVPGSIGRLGIFTPKPIRTRGIEIMHDKETLRLIPTSEIGAPEVEQARDSGLIQYLRTVRLAKKDRVEAHEIQDIINSYQQPNGAQLRSWLELLVARTAKLKQEWAMTAEYHMLGAIQGLLLDADGSTVIYNYFNEFGVTQPTTVSIDFTGLAQANFNQFFVDTFARPIARSLKDRVAVPGQAGIAALVGDAFWAKLMTHTGFYAAALTQQAQAVLAAQAGINTIGGSNSPLLQNTAWQTVVFGGVTWINYMGTDDGTTIAIPSRQAIFFPTGVQDVFRMYFGPGETFKDANQLPSSPWFLYQQMDPRDAMPSFVDIFLRSYPLWACIFPQALMRAQIATGQ